MAYGLRHHLRDLLGLDFFSTNEIIVLEEKRASKYHCRAIVGFISEWFEDGCAPDYCGKNSSKCHMGIGGALGYYDRVELSYLIASFCVLLLLSHFTDWLRRASNLAGGVSGVFWNIKRFVYLHKLYISFGTNTSNFFWRNIVLFFRLEWKTFLEKITVFWTKESIFSCNKFINFDE